MGLRVQEDLEEDQVRAGWDPEEGTGRPWGWLALGEDGGAWGSASTPGLGKYSGSEDSRKGDT